MKKESIYSVKDGNKIYEVVEHSKDIRHNGRGNIVLFYEKKILKSEEGVSYLYEEKIENKYSNDEQDLSTSHHEFKSEIERAYKVTDTTYIYNKDRKRSKMYVEEDIYNDISFSKVVRKTLIDADLRTKNCVQITRELDIKTGEVAETIVRVINGKIESVKTNNDKVIQHVPSFKENDSTKIIWYND